MTATTTAAGRSKIRKWLGRVLVGTVAAGTVAGASIAAAAPAEAIGSHPNLFPQGKVIAKPSVSVRNAPTVHARVVDHVRHGRQIDTYCKVAGSVVDGNIRWYLVGQGKWAPARYIKNVSSGPGPAHPPPCGSGTRFGGEAIADVTVRRAPNTADNRIRTLHKGQRVKIVCKVQSQNVNGNRLWYRLQDATWAPARYVKNVGANKNPMWCG